MQNLIWYIILSVANRNPHQNLTQVSIAQPLCKNVTLTLYILINLFIDWINCLCWNIIVFFGRNKIFGNRFVKIIFDFDV